MNTQDRVVAAGKMAAHGAFNIDLLKKDRVVGRFNAVPPQVMYDQLREAGLGINKTTHYSGIVEVSVWGEPKFEIVVPLDVKVCYIDERHAVGKLNSSEEPISTTLAVVFLEDTIKIFYANDQVLLSPNYVSIAESIDTDDRYAQKEIKVIRVKYGEIVDARKSS